MAVLRGSDVLEASQARVYADDGRVIGAGFLVAGDVLCTCAHVVARALGLPGAGPEEPPDRAVEVDFPLVTGRPRVRATVEAWRTGGADVALLRLDEPVEGTRPAPLVDGTGVWEHPFRTMGFPAGAGHGSWAHGTLRARLGSGWVQMETSEPGPRIVQGFSGAPVWDDRQNGVVGMTVAAHLEERTAYLLPSADLVDEATLVPRCPFQGLTAFTEDEAEFFHGRDADTERLLAAVRGRSVTLVAGPSGCGKSSLVSAGVLPRLRAAGAAVTELRPVPGVRPAAVLARALAGVLEPELGEVERLSRAEELAGLLEANRDFAAELRARVLARGGGTGGHVLFVDQLEEYVSAGPDAGRTLFGLLGDLAGGGLRVVATARPGSLDALITAGTSDLVSEAVRFLAPLTAEDLGRAVTAPVDAVPGLWFEAGLPERIVADAGDEPGRMPLVQFALTELWRRRSRAMLTHAAYDELGGVAGALVGFADQAYEKLSGSERGLARRLFVQLARPGDGDAFTRRPSRTTDLAPELVELARGLVPDKLVVLSHAPGSDEHEEIVDLAHEALTVHWPRLRRWLTESRSFRRWQEQVRADLVRWQSQQREPARLLSGTDLAEAELRLAEHPDPDDISAAEREYVHLSRRQARRGTRLRQAAVAVLAALTVLAVVLAFTTYRSLRQAEGQLRVQAAGLLAQASEERPPNDPGTALQLALAAWHAADTPQSRQALAHQYARGQYVTGTRPSLWPGSVGSLAASADGRVLVVESEALGGERSTLTVITGALDGNPRARRLSGVPEGRLRVAVSPDGRSVAATAGPEATRLWQLGEAGARRPVTLDPGLRKIREQMNVSLDFSSDSKRLLLAVNPLGGCVAVEDKCGPAVVVVWDTGSGGRPGPAHRVALQDDMDDAAFTSDADSVALLNTTVAGVVVDVRDLASGDLLYSRRVAGPDTRATFQAGGEVVAHVDNGKALELDRASAGKVLELGRAPGRSYEVPVSGHLPDATGRYTIEYLILDEAKLKGPVYSEQILTDVRTGRTFHTRVPSSGDSSVYESGLVAVPAEDGGLTVLAAVGSTLVKARAEPVGSGHFHSVEGNGAPSPDKRFLARAGSGRLAVLDISRGRQRSVRLPEPVGGRSADWEVTWTADSRRLVLWDRRGGLYWSYAAADLGSPRLVLRGALPGFGSVQGVAGIGGSEIAVVSDDARLARIDAADGKVTTRPFAIHQGRHDEETLDELFTGSQLVARPGHPGQAAVVTSRGSGRGEILLWDLRGPRLVDELRGAPVSSLDQALTDGLYNASLAFDPSGTRLAVVNADSQVRVWDLSSGKQSARGIPWKTDDKLVGPAPDGHIVVLRDGQLHFIGPDGDGNDFSVPALPGFAHVAGNRLIVDSGAVRQSFELRPEAQFRALCHAAGRDYTAAERKLLQNGTPDEPPCS
ncbi:trypsin-like peptidase domain-containing protein [Streptomyces atratus]|uniref:nSTAND1 domain-containing NTPase n=1 Tax=Streptomyces atratus TaxID=1893 RepID=UPI0021A71840|nr:trypsin-like peptidase domain-containing protein [Streptomyces atratus]MCT2541408.1 AAA family ATPase [Streptomyces atratus]